MEMRLKVIQRTGEATWTGAVPAGRGLLGTGSQILTDQPYTFAARFQDEAGTNPEELIAAAHAACYSMAFAATLGEKGYAPQEISTRATCTLEPTDGGYRITRMRLEVRGRVPEIDQAAFRGLAEEADRGCPVSNLLRPGSEIEISAALE